MTRRARMALSGASVGLILLALTWFGSHHVALLQRADASILAGFVQLHRARINALTGFIAGLCDPHSYVLLVTIPVVIALLRRRPGLAIMIGLVVLGANETTQLLKPLFAGSHDYVYGGPTTSASWPSGHATAAMTLALCMVLAVPSRWRPAVGAAMAAFTVAVCYSFLELGWHYPSDVLGGFEVATIWTLTGIAGLSTIRARRAHTDAPPGAPLPAYSSLVEVLRPVAGVAAGALLCLSLVLLARPHAVLQYAAGHVFFVAGAGVIAAAAMALASGLALMLRRT